MIKAPLSWNDAQKVLCLSDLITPGEFKPILNDTLYSLVTVAAMNFLVSFLLLFRSFLHFVNRLIFFESFNKAF